MLSGNVLNDMNVTADVLYGELYKEVQLKGVFDDSKTFNDCIPKISPKEIREKYEQRKSSSDWNLSEFVNEYFDLAKQVKKCFERKKEISIVDHLNNLWDELSRENRQSIEGSSLIPIPYPYIVPGGRFNELFYWDTYFTMLGLEYWEKGKVMIEYLLDNYCSLIDRYGFIPNGTRTYFLSRSQPPVFSLMIQLFAQLNSNSSDIRLKYLPHLEKEYRFWMDGIDQLNENEIFCKVCST